MHTLFACFTFLVVFALPCSARSYNEIIHVDIPNLSPESFAYSQKRGKFFLGSLNFGTVYEVDQTGNFSQFVMGKELSSTAGILAVDDMDLLLICNFNQSMLGAWVGGKPAFKGFQTSLIVANLTTGAIIRNIDFSNVGPGPFRLVNDITHDSRGNFWLTDSLGAQIIHTTLSGNPSVFVHNDDWTATKPQRGFGPDGIAYQPSCDCILMTHLQHGTIWNVPREYPMSFFKVEFTNIESIQNPDGARFSPDMLTYYVVNNQAGLLYQFVTNSNWTSLTLNNAAVTPFSNPTGVTFTYDQVWCSTAYLFQKKQSYPIYSMPLPPLCE
eukprot:TRINITY_DN38079_c0_g1_i1.p1 TRINITY_DN38079_c0_g1~~TRINITY_DN38079_c0_g1_i1.p1  ORF type:complete len:326 (-),score=32.55 TRINITY_DN38079_c0_g1_i1:117-1094(-)